MACNQLATAVGAKKFTNKSVNKIRWSKSADLSMDYPSSLLSVYTPVVDIKYIFSSGFFAISLVKFTREMHYKQKLTYL